MKKWMKVQLVALVAVLVFAVAPMAQAQVGVGLTSMFTLRSVISDNTSARLLLMSVGPGRVGQLRFFHAELMSSLTTGTLASFSLLQTMGYGAGERAARYLLSEVHLELASTSTTGNLSRGYSPSFTLPLPADRADFYHETGRSLGSTFAGYSFEAGGQSATWTVTIGIREEIK